MCSSLFRTLLQINIEKQIEKNADHALYMQSGAWWLWV